MKIQCQRCFSLFKYSHYTGNLDLAFLHMITIDTEDQVDQVLGGLKRMQLLYITIVSIVFGVGVLGWNIMCLLYELTPSWFTVFVSILEIPLLFTLSLVVVNAEERFMECYCSDSEYWKEHPIIPQELKVLFDID